MSLSVKLGRVPERIYLDGDVELVGTSEEHERIKKWIAACMDDYFYENEIPNVPRGQATMRLVSQSGAEPDESWCVGEAKTYPDIVLEIALTSGGLPKREIYRRFAIPEVWLWRRGRLEIHLLRKDRSGYDEAPGSRLLPTLRSRTWSAPWPHLIGSTPAGLSARRYIDNRAV